VKRKAKSVIIDPRTLLPVTAPSDCHLIPDCIKYGDPPPPVSNKTVSLDGPFDHRIGSQCDHQLKTWLDTAVGDYLKGEASFEGGAQKLGSTLHVSARRLFIKPSPSRRRWKPAPPQDWLCKTLGMQDDRPPTFTGFVGQVVDTAKARLSLVNSAILVLYYLGRRDFGPEFDWARALLKKVAADAELGQSDLSVIEQSTQLMFLLATEKIQGTINPAEFRNHYRPDVDMPDGVLEHFPNNSVTEDDEALLVRLPYGKGLRGLVRFSKNL
jgi:hypothetical protein